jgi:anti-sigma factor RsiW
MNTMNHSTHNSTGTDCKTCRAHLSDLLLDDTFTATHPELAAHLAACTACEQELSELRSTFALLDDWTAPEPSPYFDSKLQVRLREAQAAGPEGFWERTRSFFLFSTGRHFRPALTAALAFAMLIGGGGLGVMLHQPAPTASATVNDLKILDNNAQALQQMDQLLDEPAPSTDDNSAPPTT